MSSSSSALGALRWCRRRLWKMSRISPIPRWNLVKGDKVQVLSGPDAGKQGVVTKVRRGLNQLVVSGVNLHKRVIPADGASSSHFAILESPVHYSQLALVDPEKGQPTRIKRVWLEDGKKVRLSRLSGSVVPREVVKGRYRPVNLSTDTPGPQASLVTHEALNFDAIGQWIKQVRAEKTAARLEREKLWRENPAVLAAHRQAIVAAQRAVGARWIRPIPTLSESEKNSEKPAGLIYAMKF